ncbi:MAG: hypothetical protein M1816_008053 [Peltula sp. TS41687]|nr:MAG: hypothetical protein M1816_008053 [Peltula sp. TS41687]
MLSTRRDVRWNGFLRFTPLILITIIIFSIPNLGISIVHLRELATWPMESSYKHPSKALLVFYTLTVPVLSLFHASTDLILFFRSGLAPLYSLVGSIVALGAWWTQWGILLDCESGGDDGNGVESYCPNYNFMEIGNQFDYYMVTALLGLEAVIWAAYAVYLGFAATAVHRQRRERKLGQKLGGKGDLDHELGQVA